jgi:hypothetical protein
MGLLNLSFGKKIIIFFIGVIFLLIIFVIIFNSGSKNTPNKTSPTPTPIKTSGNLIKTSPTPTPMIHTEGQATFELKDRKEMDTVLHKAIGFTDKDIAISGYYISGDWAIVSSEPKNLLTDNTNTVLKRQAGEWIVFAGPSTYFDREKLINRGVPLNIAEKAEIIPISIIFEITPGP